MITDTGENNTNLYTHGISRACLSVKSIVIHKDVMYPQTTLSAVALRVDSIIFFHTVKVKGEML